MYLLKFRFEQSLIFILPLFFIFYNLPVLGDSTLTHNVGNTEMMVSDWGTFTRFDNGNISPSFLYSGRYYLDPFSEIWIGDADGHVASAYDNFENDIILGEWQSEDTTGQVQYADDSGNASQTIYTRYLPNRYNDYPYNIAVEQYTYAWDSAIYPDDDDYIIVKLVLKNLDVVDLEDFYIAINSNWDVDYSDELDDLVDWDAEYRSGITYDSDGTDQTYLALTLLEGELASHNITKAYAWQYLDSQRSLLMANGEIDDLNTISRTPGNYSSVISSGPYNMSPDESVTAIYAFAAGKGLDELHTNIRSAKRRIIIPGELTAVSSKASVDLSWNKPISSAVSDYVVYRRVEGEDDYEKLADVSWESTEYRDTKVEIGIIYEYRITTIDIDSMESDFSNHVKASPGVAPPSPRNLTANVFSDTNITLNWDLIDQESVEGYMVYRNFTGDEPWTPIAKIEKGISSFTDSNVYQGNTYYYTLSSTNAYGWTSDYSNVVSITIDSYYSSNAFVDLINVKTAPNPCFVGLTDSISFLNLTSRAEISIYTLSGELVQTLYHMDSSREKKWDMLNNNGVKIASGVYIYRIEAFKPEKPGKFVKTGKFAVVD
ncbi:hypothetical protein GF312_11780 [Candidatus Poribacteria bacterium]|nr:hypothetical protein [Candidatus Poribacteria bacterium]